MLTFVSTRTQIHHPLPTPSHLRYYLDDALALLDSPGEWWLNRSSWTLHMWTPDGRSPSAHRVSAKVLPWITTAMQLFVTIQLVTMLPCVWETENLILLLLLLLLFFVLRFVLLSQAHDYCLSMQSAGRSVVANLTMRGCTVAINDCNNCVVRACVFRRTHA